jgi:hypothetical protein
MVSAALPAGRTRAALLTLAGRWLTAWVKANAPRLVAVLVMLRSLTLTVTAFAGFTAAAYMYGAHWAGIVVGSVSLLVIEYLVKRP